MSTTRKPYAGAGYSGPRGTSRGRDGGKRSPANSGPISSSSRVAQPPRDLTTSGSVVTPMAICASLRNEERS